MGKPNSERKREPQFQAQNETAIRYSCLGGKQVKVHFSSLQDIKYYVSGVHASEV